MLDFNIVTPPADDNHHHDPFDRESIRTELLTRLESVLFGLFPAGKKRQGKFLIGDVHGSKGDSLEVVLTGQKAGLWTDRATGEGGDVFDLVAAARGLDSHTGFAQVLEHARQWLGRAPAAPAPRKRKQPPIDDLGPATGKWDYLDAAGQLIAVVYRYDPPGGKKEFRPWDVKRRKATPPDPRPLYNQPGLLEADQVVLVEGEKCAQALIDQGITATTAMQGANAPVDKTDWSPLQGKEVLIWPDADEAGARYADAVAQQLRGIAARVRRIRVPPHAPSKWDAADAIAEGFDVRALLAEAEDGTPQPPGHFDILTWHAIDRFSGAPPARRWLVPGVFPMAQVSLVAAGGGVGKSFLLLALARAVSAFDGRRVNAPLLFGGELSQYGVAVYLTAEDDAIEVHSRLHSLGTIPARLYALPLPDAGGAMALFAPDPLTRGPSVTPSWSELARQLQSMSQAKSALTLVVLDPLQPLCALDLNVPENAQFVCSRLSVLATSTGAAVIASHHFAKREVTTPEQAREAIRGTGGLVDGVRSVYALWHPREEQAKSVCRTLHQSYVRGCVVMGGVVKANGQANLAVSTYVRDVQGLLVDRSPQLARVAETDGDLLMLLQEAIAHAARCGQPYTKTGINGPYERRHELPESLRGVAKHRMVDLISSLLEGGAVVSAMAEGSRLVKWLDVPEGPIAAGEAIFAPGHLSRSAAGRRPAPQPPPE